MTQHRIVHTTSVASVYRHDVAKAEQGAGQAEVDEIIGWLTGFGPDQSAAHLAAGTDFGPSSPRRPGSTRRGPRSGRGGGVRVEEVAEPLMREIRDLDKLIDELAKGRAMDKILRG